MTVYTLADVTCTGAAQTVGGVIGTSGLVAKWVRFIAVTVTSGSAPIRVGNAAASGRGLPMIAAGNVIDFPPIAEQTSSYALDTIGLFGAANDKVAIAYAL